MSKSALEALYYISIVVVLAISWTGAWYLHSDSGYITAMTVTAAMINKLIERNLK